jgi:hypothetical protein
MERRNITDERSVQMLADQLLDARNELHEARALLERVHAWATTAKNWKGTKPDPFGPLHGAGWIRAFQCAGHEVLNILNPSASAESSTPIIPVSVPPPSSPPLSAGELDYLLGLCDQTDETKRRVPGLHQINIDSYVLRSLITEVKMKREVVPPKEDGAGLGASPSAEGDRAFVLRTEPPPASPPSGLQSLARDPEYVRSQDDPDGPLVRGNDRFTRIDSLPHEMQVTDADFEPPGAVGRDPLTEGWTSK